MAGGAANPGMFAQALAEQEEQRRRYGQFTGYSPAQNGGYNFDLASGGQRQFTGPEAEALRGRIDAARGAAAQPAPSQVNTLFSTKGGGQLGLKDGGNPQNPMDWVVREGPRAATRGGMQARSMTSQGGYTVNEEFLDQMESSQIKLAAAQELGQKAAAEQAALKQGYFQEQKAQIAKEQAEAAKDQQVKQRRMGELQSKYDDAEKRFLGFSDEQEARANTTGEKVKTFVGALAAGFGALGAALARTPNFAAEAVERHNEREMRKQEAELRIRKDAKDSLLGQLQQQTGSVELARTAGRAILSRQAALGWEQLAQKEGDENKKTTMLAAAEMQNQNYLKWREQYTRMAEGEVTRTFQYVPGSAGSRGGVRAPTLDEAQAAANLSKTYAETDRTRQGESGSSARSLPTERTTLIADAAEVVRLGKGILSNPVLEGDDSFFGPKGSVLSKVPLTDGALAGKDNQRYRQDAQQWINRRIKEMTGAGVGVQEAQRLAAAEVGEGSKNEIRHGVEAGVEAAKHKLRTNFAALSPEQQREVLATLPPEARDAVLGRGP